MDTIVHLPPGVLVTSTSAAPAHGCAVAMGRVTTDIASITNAELLCHLKIVRVYHV